MIWCNEGPRISAADVERIDESLIKMGYDCIERKVIIAELLG